MLLSNISSVFCNRLFKKVIAQESVERDPERLRSGIRASRHVLQALTEFVKMSSFPVNFVPLGQNCSTAWYLKQVGVKQVSYPFDWIFSSCEIVEHCIKDKFNRFLDVSQIYDNGNGTAGHTHYHAKMFNHRSPLNSIETLQYYQRCCDRFLNILESDEPIIFVITLINEGDKRPDWFSGFTQHFPRSNSQNFQTVRSLHNLLKSRNSSSRMIVVEQYTDSDVDIDAQFKWVSDDLFHIKFHASAGNSGTRYVDETDDFCFKLIMSGLA